MKRTTLAVAAAALMICSANAQDDLAPITLNAPDLNRPASLMQAFSKRASNTNYADRALSLQDMSDLLWAANGFNRPAEKKRTAPSALNFQDIDIYVFLAEGAYFYDAEASVLKPVAKGDFRAEIVPQLPPKDMPHPPALLVLVSDLARHTRNPSEPGKAKAATIDAGTLKTAALDAGIVSQNISIFCAGVGMVTRCRASLNTEKLKGILNLSDAQLPILNHPVGYGK